MSAPNAFIANGTCYYAPGEELDQWFPCGNAALGDKTCCQGGDMCLSSRACYNPQFGITYLAGCSDPEYRDSSCPDKGPFEDHPWTGLVYCNGTSEEWVACEQSAQPTTLASADPCWCPQTSRTVAFTDGSILDNVVQLPTALGGSVIWQPGYVPVPTQPDTTTTAAATSASSMEVSTTAASNTAPPPPPPPPTETGANGGDDGDEGGLASSTKVGIGVGLGAGCTVLIAVLIFLFIARRRMQRKGPSEMDHHHHHTKAAEHGMSPINSPITPATASVSELEPNAARPWSMRTELDGTSRRESEISYGDGAKFQGQAYPSATGKPRYDRKSDTRGSGAPTGPIAELPG